MSEANPGPASASERPGDGVRGRSPRVEVRGGGLRIVVLCPHFRPDTAPTGTVMTRIVEELARAATRCTS